MYTDFTLNIFISAISQCTDQKPQIYNYRYFRDTLKISILDDGMLFGFGFPLCIDGNLAFNFTEKNVTITVRFFILLTLTYSYESGKQGDFSGHL